MSQPVFPPDVLARIAPDVSLQRHLSIGLRPSLRNFLEFADSETTLGNLNKLGENNVVGSAITKKGDTSILCGITLGVVEDLPQDEFTSIYPVVEVVRGRSGAPTDEEMILSQRLYETILHSKVIPTSSLSITPGYQVDNKIYYPGSGNDELLQDIPAFNNGKSYSFVLYAHLKVFSRTGPLFDACYNTLTQALTDVKLPQLYVGDTSSQIKVPVRSRGNFGHLSGGDNLHIDPSSDLMYQLELNKQEIGISSTFGVVDLENLREDTEIDRTVVLADLEGDAEESTISSRIGVVAGPSGTLKSVSIIGGSSNITLDVLKQAVDVSITRAKLSK